MLARAHPPDAPAADRITGGTFHAIAHRLIRAHAESFSLPPDFTVIDPADVTDVLDTLRADHDLVGTRRRAPRAATCADIYTRCVNTGTPVVEMVAEGFPWCADFTAQLGGLFRAYTAHKRAHGMIDFDDLLLLWRAALADPAAGPALRGLFDAVLVDEYQDVNAVQADIVRLLRPDGRGPDLRRRRRAGHLRLPWRRPGAPARADGLVPGPDRGPAGPQLPLPARGAPAGQRGPAAVGGAGAGADRGP